MPNVTYSFCRCEAAVVKTAELESKLQASHTQNQELSSMVNILIIFLHSNCDTFRSFSS